MGGSIGSKATDTWKPYSNEDRENHVKKVERFMAGLKDTSSESAKHEKLLKFMADNGIRQLGPPRIGIYAAKQRPEPLHCEINAWQQVLNIIYQESVQRKVFEQFLSVLAAPPKLKSVPEESTAPITGCGLQYLVPSLKEHFKDEKKRFNKISTRLIGEQAIAIAQYGYKLVDCLEYPEESPAERVKRFALGQIVLSLRNAGALFNKISATRAEILELEEVCKLYFNLLCLFYPSHVNVTCWTVGYAIPYHASKLFDAYNVGYGIISQQGKEAKHSAIKDDLNLSNRSNNVNESGKWWQVMRANYVKSVYLPEHQPVPQTYKSHFKSRIPQHCVGQDVCNCGRMKQEGIDICKVCVESNDVMMSAEKMELTPQLLQIFKPCVCSKPGCGERFADQIDLNEHELLHERGDVSLTCKNPKEMSVAELKTELKKRNLSTGGRKDILVKRLESSLWVHTNYE